MKRLLFSIGIIGAGLMAGCAGGAKKSAPAPATLKAAFKSNFLIGVAVNQDQFSGKDPRGEEIITTQFNSISPENVLKWESVHPEPNRYNFAPADRYVAFGESNHMVIIGHTLVWHSQTPDWVFRVEGGTNEVDRDTLLQRMRDHIHTVVGRYKGRIKAWDVVNEAINFDGSWRDTPWHRIIGDDFIAKAFQFAHEADPDAELTYNDFALEDAPKRGGVIAMIKQLQAQGAPITGIGSQTHVKLHSPSPEETDAALTDLAALKLQILITELDVDVLPSATNYRGADISLNVPLQDKLNPYTNGLPASVQQELAKRYAGLFRVFLKHRDEIRRVTFWCVTDGDSWLNYWPVKTRTSYPLLFDRNGQPKPAFDAVIQTTHWLPTTE